MTGEGHAAPGPQPESLLDCIDCGGRAHLLTLPGEWGWQAGQVAVYRCEDCHDRWDVVVGDPDDNPDDKDP